MGSRRLGRFLEVVGWQTIVARRDEGLEETPRPPGDQAQAMRVGLYQRTPARDPGR